MNMSVGEALMVLAGCVFGAAGVSILVFVSLFGCLYRRGGPKEKNKEAAK